MEIRFNKYETRGEGYHWRQNSGNPLHMSAFVKGRYAKCIDLLRQALGELRGARVLDFGCGDGAFSYSLSQTGARVVGVDSSEVAIAYARKRHGAEATGAEFHCESCYQTPFADASFDALISTDVIEHVQEPDRFLGEIQRVLKPGGVAVISTPIRLTEKPLDPLHVVEWFPSEYEQVIRAHFPDATFHRSHPVGWHEFAQRNKTLHLLVNLLSLFGNPYLRTRKWQIFSLQYAVCRKRDAAGA